MKHLNLYSFCENTVARIKNAVLITTCRNDFLRKSFNYKMWEFILLNGYYNLTHLPSIMLQYFSYLR